MIQPRTAYVRKAVATLASAAILAVFISGIARAQPSLGLGLEVVDARGTAWDLSSGEEALVDLEGVSDRRLEVRAGPSVGGAASISIAVDGVALAPVDLEVAERELATTVTTDTEEIVAASARDPLVWPAGFTYSTGTDLMLGFDPPHGEQLIYVAFDDVTVAPGAEVVRAAVRFSAVDTRDGPLTLQVFAVTALPADAVLQDVEGTSSGTLTAATKSQLSVDWVLEPSWSAGEKYETPDLSALVADAWDDPAVRASGSLAFVFAVADGEGTRRAHSVDGRRRDAPVLVLSVREPVATAFPIEVPAGASEVTIALHPERAGVGEPIASTTFRVTAETAEAPEPAAPPVDAAEPTAPEPAAPVATPEPAAPPAPLPPAASAPEPTEPPSPAGELATADGEVSIWVADLDTRDDRSSLVTVLLREPTRTDVVPALRFGTCAALGDVLIELNPVPTGERGSTTVVQVPTPVLRLSGVVAVLQGVPGACAPLRH